MIIEAKLLKQNKTNPNMGTYRSLSARMITKQLMELFRENFWMQLLKSMLYQNIIYLVPD